jgi:hypothetical protein
MVKNRIFGEVAAIIQKYREMKHSPVTAQKRHATAYKPIHKELEFLWASLRASGYLKV